MKNCHDHIDVEEITKHLYYFMARMQAAGYDQDFRLQVLKSAYKAYESKKIEEKEMDEEKKRSTRRGVGTRKEGKNQSYSLRRPRI